MNNSLRLPCPTCSGTRSTTTGDRHADTNMDVCATCHDEGTIPARPGESPEASFQFVNQNTTATDGKDFPKTGMSFPESGNEARTALAGKITNARRYADREGFMLSTICPSHEETTMLLTALATPLRAAEKPEAAARLSGIYIASKTAHAERWKGLRAAGVPIISTWIDEAGVGESSDLGDLWRRCIDEASGSTCLVVYREPGEVLKGAFVEIGAALAAGRTVYAVGLDDLTVAHHAGIVRCASLDEAILAASLEVSQVPEPAMPARAQRTEHPHAGRFWLELREPRRVPERKGSWPMSETAKVLREVMAARPQAYITVVTVGHAGPDFDDGPETLQMIDARSMSTGTKHMERTRAAHGSHEQRDALVDG